MLPDVKFPSHKSVMAKKREVLHLKPPPLFIFFFSIGAILLSRIFSCDLYLKIAMLLKQNLFFYLIERAQEKSV